MPCGLSAFIPHFLQLRQLHDPNHDKIRKYYKIYFLSIVTIRYISHRCYFEHCRNCFSKHIFNKHSRPIMHMCIEFAKYRELGNFAVSMGRPQATMLQLQGALPLDPAGGSAPYPHNYRLALRAHHVSPNFHDSPPKCWEAG